MFSDLAMDATERKVYGEGEWKVTKHGTDRKRRVWRKLHLALDTNMHEIIVTELSLSNVSDGESMKYLAMVLMAQGRVMKRLTLNELSRSSLRGKALPSGNKVILAI
ncbi:hypothetical protein TUMSATVNIG1_56140 (plasmid) [Vibrio nigripulchritudo]|nr:hypothetical protein VNTUMSATTG_55740 [Vibrio nigripulchritudo]BDU35005.1 hypothetical protein TUMSATVNIG1_56140 [Vibrio nigripulchritudo]